MVSVHSFTAVGTSSSLGQETTIRQAPCRSQKQKQTKSSYCSYLLGKYKGFGGAVLGNRAESNIYIYLLLFHNPSPRGLSKEKPSFIPRFARIFTIVKYLETAQERGWMNGLLHIVEHYPSPIARESEKCHNLPRRMPLFQDSGHFYRAPSSFSMRLNPNFLLEARSQMCSQ